MDWMCAQVHQDYFLTVGTAQIRDGSIYRPFIYLAPDACLDV